MGTITCQNCGAKNDAGRFFCIHCGTRLEPEETVDETLQESLQTNAGEENATEGASRGAHFAVPAASEANGSVEESANSPLEDEIEEQSDEEAFGATMLYDMGEDAPAEDGFVEEDDGVAEEDVFLDESAEAGYGEDADGAAESDDLENTDVIDVIDIDDTNVLANTNTSLAEEDVLPLADEMIQEGEEWATNAAGENAYTDTFISEDALEEVDFTDDFSGEASSEEVSAFEGDEAQGTFFESQVNESALPGEDLQASQTGSFIVCPQCGALNDPSNSFCNECGSPLGTPEQAPGYGVSEQAPNYGTPEQIAGFGVPETGFGAPEQTPGYGAPEQVPAYGVAGQTPGYGVPGQPPAYGVAEVPGQPPAYGVAEVPVPPAGDMGQTMVYAAPAYTVADGAAEAFFSQESPLDDAFFPEDAPVLREPHNHLVEDSVRESSNPYLVLLKQEEEGQQATKTGDASEPRVSDGVGKSAGNEPNAQVYEIKGVPTSDQTSVMPRTIPLFGKEMTERYIIIICVVFALVTLLLAVFFAANPAGIVTGAFQNSPAAQDLRFDDLQTLISENEERTNELENQMTVLQEDGQTMQEQLDDLSTENEALKDVNDDLTTQVDDLNTQNTSLQQERDTAQQENTTLQQENTSLEERNSTLQEQYDTLAQQLLTRTTTSTPSTTTTTPSTTSTTTPSTTSTTS